MAQNSLKRHNNYSKTVSKLGHATKFVRATQIRTRNKRTRNLQNSKCLRASRHFGTVFLTVLLNISSIYFHQSRMKTFSYLNIGFFQCRAPSICVRIIPEPMHMLPRLCLSVSSVKKPRRICRDQRSASIGWRFVQKCSEISAFSHENHRTKQSMRESIRLKWPPCCQAWFRSYGRVDNFQFMKAQKLLRLDKIRCNLLNNHEFA